MRQYENINKLVMMENEAAYKKASQERENTHRIMKTTFDPSNLKRRHEVERLMDSQDLQRHKSINAISSNVTREIAHIDIKTQPSPNSSMPWTTQDRFYPALAAQQPSLYAGVGSIATENPRYEDFLKKRIQTKLVREANIERVSQLGSPRTRTDEKRAQAINIVQQKFFSSPEYRDPASAQAYHRKNQARLAQIEATQN